MEQRRAFLAAILCLLVLIGYQEGLRYFYPQPLEEEPLRSSPASATPLARDQPAADIAVEAGEQPAAVAGREISIETDLYAARVTTTGGRLVSFRLKKFRSAVDEASPPLELVEVAPNAAPPLGLRFVADDGKVLDDTGVVYAADREQVTLTGSETGVLTFSGALPSGEKIEKSLLFTGDAYPITVGVRADGLPAKFSRVGLSWRRHVVIQNHSDPEAYYRGAVILAKNKVVHELASGMEAGSQKSFPEPVGWAGYADHYFLAALVPPIRRTPPPW